MGPSSHLHHLLIRTPSHCFPVPGELEWITSCHAACQDHTRDKNKQTSKVQWGESLEERRHQAHIPKKRLSRRSLKRHVSSTTRTKYTPPYTDTHTPRQHSFSALRVVSERRSSSHQKKENKRKRKATIRVKVRHTFFVCVHRKKDYEAAQLAARTVTRVQRLNSYWNSMNKWGGPEQ